MGAAGTEGLTCVYMVDLSRRYVRMAVWSIRSLRHRNPGVPVVVLVADDDHELDHDAAELLDHLQVVADEVRFVEPLHRTSGYFLDNRAHVGSVRDERLLYLDADTLVFGDLRALVDRFERCDVAARPSEWAWRGGYSTSMAPDIICPMNSGAVLMSAEFAATWSGESASRMSSLMERPDRDNLAAWLRSVSPTAWSREEWAFSELAWEGPWSVGLFTDSDCHLLTREPGEEDPLRWRQSTIFHTYNPYWTLCVKRLLAR